MKKGRLQLFVLEAGESMVQHPPASRQNLKEVKAGKRDKTGPFISDITAMAVRKGRKVGFGSQLENAVYHSGEGKAAGEWGRRVTTARTQKEMKETVPSFRSFLVSLGPQPWDSAAHIQGRSSFPHSLM